MIHHLSNTRLSIAVDERGAELRSLVREDGLQQLLWQGNPQYWDGQSPILFPTVGNSYEQTIHHHGQPYPMPKHGLVREMTFTLARQTTDTLELAVESNDETLRHYPFPFRLSVCYQLREQTLTVTFRVTNLGEEPLPFLLGAHPAFNLPDFAPDNPVHGYLGFEGLDKLVSLGLQPGGFAWPEGVFDVPLTEGLLPLTNHTFDCDTLLDATSLARACVLYNKERKPVLTVRFDAPVLALWAPCGGRSPFVCIEPWWGLCDETGYRGEFSGRPYINTVAVGSTGEIKYSVEVL